MPSCHFLPAIGNFIVSYDYIQSCYVKTFLWIHVSFFGTTGWNLRLLHNVINVCFVKMIEKVEPDSKIKVYVFSPSEDPWEVS